MKTISTTKRLLSMLLATIMIISMMTVGMVTSFAAETDTAQTGAGTTVYFQNNWKWTDVRIHVWNSSKQALTGNWPGAAMTKVGTSGEYDYYKYTLPTNACGFIFNGIKNDGFGARDQSPDIVTIPTNDHFYYMNYNNGNQCLQANESITVKFPSEGGTTDPTDPPSEVPTDGPTDPVDTTTICFRDDYDSVDTDDADVYVQFDGGDKVKMTKTVDTMSGHDMWYADMPENATSVKFIRASVVNKAEWNTWSASLSGNTTGLYRATGWGTGSWGTSTHYYAIPDKEDINNYSFGIWADTKGNGNLYDLVIARQNSSSEYHLYLPSNTPNSVKLYTSFASLTIGSTTVTDGTAVTLNAGSSYSMTFKQTQHDTSNKTATLKVYKTTDTATLLFQTKRDLYTGKVGESSVSGYKDAIETKGSYYLYDEDGNIVNSDPVLKKIKGRGNSSFEASMKLYGKYAYNFNLDKKVALIDGATESKKWCLLANNPDVTMLRNTFIYQLADELGVKYAPETRLVDVYDNGYYLGAYVITEKVEYGKNTLMKDMKNLDDGNEDANIEAYQNEDIMDDLEGHLIQKTSSYTTNGKTYSYQYTTSDDTTNWPYHQPSDYQDYNYLLEFELHNRYTNEASWFVSPRTNQAVVVKYPEFATQDEMKWIIAQYEAAESAIYSNDTDTIKTLVDVDSFAKMYLLQELSVNLDSCATSYYIHNDLTSGKLVASPVWDYDWAFGAYAKNLKYVYNGSSVTTSANMSDPKQMFVKNKALQTDAGGRADGKAWISNYNFQAKLVHNSYVWERCQYFWTNDLADLLYKYVKDDSADQGIIIDTYLSQFTSAVNMNNARWGSYTYTGDNWGTKVTTDYTPYSYDFKVGNCGTSGSSSKNYSNSVYYLNDWIKTRRDYMSSSTGGNLYNASLVDPYKLNSVTLNATQSGADVTVSVDFDATYNGTQVANTYKAFDLYVNGNLEGNYAITDTPVVTLTENVETSIYVVAYLTGDKDAYNMTSATKKFTYVVTGPEYVIENVTFTAVQSADEKTVKITPAYGKATVDGVDLKPEEVQYTVYLNGEIYDKKTFETTSLEVTLADGKVNEIYIIVSPVAAPTTSATSMTQKFSCNVVAEKVNVTINFKSSASTRYIPNIKVNGNTTATAMTKGQSIGKNASQTQTYNWFTANVELEIGKATNITFTNSYSMNATIAVTPTADGDVYYFAVDNLNQGSQVVDLSNAEEYVRNFKRSASHMVYNDTVDGDIATTSINGKMLKMGDSDEDNTLTVLDATNTQMAIAQKTELTETGARLADYNLDGVNSIMDATLVQATLTQ